MPNDALMKMSKADLVQICKLYNHRISGNKKDLVARIQLGPSVSDKFQGTHLDVLCANWFLKPLPRHQSLLIGSRNEHFVLKCVNSLIDFDDNIELLNGPFDLGLVISKDHPWIGTSIDGYADMKFGDKKACTTIEIKTVCTDNTLSAAQIARSQMDIVTYCDFGDQNFLRGVRSIAYRTQLLHHACVMSCNKVLFLVASSTELIYALVITISDDDIMFYRSIVDIAASPIKWAHQPEPVFPTSGFTDEGLQQKGYDVTVHDVHLNFWIWKSIMQLVREKGKPLPCCKYIGPTCVVHWNSNKSPVDLMSKYLKDIKSSSMKHLSPSSVYVIRMISILLVNSFLATKLTLLHSSDYQSDLSFKEMKKNVSKLNALKDYLYIVVESLTNFAYLQVAGDEISDSTSLLSISDLQQLRAETTNIRTNHLMKKFSQGLHCIVRLSAQYKHHSTCIEVGATRKECPICKVVGGKRRTPQTICKICGVSLCVVPQGEGEISCFDTFHSTNDLTTLLADKVIKIQQCAKPSEKSNCLSNGKVRKAKSSKRKLKSVSANTSRTITRSRTTSNTSSSHKRVKH